MTEEKLQDAWVHSSRNGQSAERDRWLWDAAEIVQDETVGGGEGESGGREGDEPCELEPRYLRGKTLSEDFDPKGAQT